MPDIQNMNDFSFKFGDVIGNSLNTSVTDTKDKLDLQPRELRNFIVGLVDILNSINGADSLAAKGYDGLKTTIQAMLNDLNTRKLDTTGDFKGTLNGMPIVQDQTGLSSTVAFHTSQLNDIVQQELPQKASKIEVQSISEQIANIVAHNGDGTKDTELIDARGSEITLRNRFDKIESGSRLLSSENLVDLTKVSHSKTIDGSGNLIDYHREVSDFMEAEYGGTYSLYGAWGNNNNCGAVYDKNMNYLMTIGSGNLAGSYGNYQYKVGYIYNSNSGWIQDPNQNNAFYVRIVMNPQEDMEMFVKSPSYPSSYIPYKVDLKSEKFKEAIEDLIQVTVNKYNTISCWGDSKTAGNQDGTGISYPSVLQNLLTQNGYDYVVNNMGVGGEYTNGIAGRQGGMPLYVQPFTIPGGTTPVQVTTNIPNNNISKQGDKGLNPCYINGIKGTLGYDYTNGYSTFTRATAGTAVSVTRPTQIVTDGMINHRGDILIIDIGTNGGFGSVDEWIKQIKCMINYSQCKEYIIIGRNVENSNPIFSCATIEPLFQMEFGNRYINLRAYEVAYGLQDVGINPTSADSAAISSGQVPPSLMYDTVHENQYGYTIKAQQVFKKLQELQIISK